jgi:hypothetical protein
MIPGLRRRELGAGLPEFNPGDGPLVTLVSEFPIAPAREDLQSS